MKCTSTMKLTKEKKAPHEQVCAVVTGQKSEGTTAGRKPITTIEKRNTSPRPQSPRHRKFLYRHYKRSKADSIVWDKKTVCTYHPRSNSRHF